MTTELHDPSPELELHLRQSFARIEPERVFRGCKVADRTGAVVVRIYSHAKRFPNLVPTPYQIYRFDVSAGSLTVLSAEEAAPYVVRNYK
jgi:hypothetical protein